MLHRFIGILAALLFGCSTGLAAPAPASPTHYTPTDTILILGAVPQEIPPFVEAMTAPEKKSLWGIPYWEGMIDDTPVVVAITGIGKTFTGMTTTLFVAEMKPRLVLMSGTGARIDPTLRTGDVIVATVTYEHDYGSLTADGMVYRPMNGPDNGAEMENAFSPPAELLARADDAIAAYEGPEVSANGETYNVTARRGVVASSDLFGVTTQRIETLRTRFDVDIMEMESAPLGHVAVSLGVPFLVIRAGSNIAQEAPNDDYLRLGPIAARQAAHFTLHLLDYL
ncbi:5'-methylthioadenosine/S-adenosylhomocysteine nucleosidase [Parvularcula bermudensis HTCC2503]|uniref:adenosylhomocysteine nucleosidase n=1 Tax=Parvularcula bermudensis (strain ATCC BAA-594 / HTCC2503 / KCTC 12087) TaxID=314260 RepID=E0TEG2_PARBH|nr:5'-methylthioadenosine/S-adenosylhomocysteine nucleosidase [Parvularcula bermudensis]ADM10048.1 5'-methylthioadenosine/S-adenosylhomocysteine nucleosidase [Parvularcula bermudensis HTCC2503]